MTAVDPLATERFRSILADVLGVGGYENSSYRHNGNVGHVADVFTDAHFEYRINGNGVAERRVAVASEWEVDPAVASQPAKRGRPARDGDLARRSDGQLIEYGDGQWHPVDEPTAGREFDDSGEMFADPA